MPQMKKVKILIVSVSKGGEQTEFCVPFVRVYICATNLENYLMISLEGISSDEMWNGFTKRYVLVYITVLFIIVPNC